MKAIVTCLIVLAAGVSAHAQRIHCQTTSAGKIFEYKDSTESFAGSFAVDLCKRDGSTVNSECQANLACYDLHNPPPVIRCDTLSNTKTFSSENRMQSLAQSLAVGQCKKDGSTVNSQCEANVVCDYADAQRRPVRCQTHSNTLIFDGQHTHEAFARTQAIDLCKKNGSTVNSQCEANVTCSKGRHGGRGPVMECKTHSAGRVFAAEDKNEQFAASLTLDRCKKDGATVNSQCEANLVCAAKRRF